ncbi:nitrate- and nitrite sensing domain-containing protein [Sulfurimonas sp.]
MLLVFNAYSNLKNYAKIEKNTLKIETISNLVNDLQQERGLSSAYISSEKKLFAKELCNKRKDVDAGFTACIAICKTDSQQFSTQEKYLHDLRKHIEQQSVETHTAFTLYTQIIKKLLIAYRKITHTIDTPKIRNILDSYTALTFMKESLGQIRGSLNGILAAKTTDKELLHALNIAQGMLALSSNKFAAISPKKYLQKFQDIKQSNDYDYMQTVLQNYHTKQQRYSPKKWFQTTTRIINKLHIMQEELLQQIKLKIKKSSKQLQLHIIFELGLFFFIVSLIAWLGLKLKNDILENMKLLNEYKNAVDRSSIVSKTDLYGRITYVNDKFCKISGYSKEELLGKAHSIVRHPDMPRSAFKDMWTTILNKKPWMGVVKNLKKDGGEYIVEVTINPILNHQGNIEEFIAIRNDITQTIRLHEELEYTQEELIFRMGEIGETRSQETGFHVKRVAKYSEILAKYYGLNEKEIKYLTYASPMHDIGKVGISDDILNKPAKLTQDEWKIMKTHTDIGYELFRDSNKPLLKTAAIVAYSHHEKWDGSGYPRGLEGENIHIYGRITAVADVFDALGSDRCYKKAWDDEKIFALLKEEKGKHFDPKLIDIFFEHLNEFLAIRDHYNDSSSFMQE